MAGGLEIAQSNRKRDIDTSEKIETSKNLSIEEEDCQLR
jgi:hypothetical protein